MTVRRFPFDASDDAIRMLIVEWSELLAQKRFADALGMFLHFDEEINWMPQTLERVIAGFGVLDPDDGVIESMLQDWGVERFEITTLVGRPDKNEIIRDKICVNRDSLYGLDPAKYVGMVHYYDVPLSGLRSDLTARFHIKRLDPQTLTLEFVDIHVL